MEEGLFRSFFDVDGITQMKCASGHHCTNPLPVNGSNHRCMNCGLKFHSCLTCSVVMLDDYLSDKNLGFEPTMLPLYGQVRLSKSSTDQFTICPPCQERLLPALVGVPAGIPLLPPMMVSTTSTRPKKKAKVSFDWQEWFDSGTCISYKSLVVSEATVNRAVGQSLTRLVGINTGDEGEDVIPIIEINLDVLRKIAARLSLVGGRSMKKLTLCDALVTLFLNRVKGNGNGNEPMTNNGKPIHWNVARYLNVMFGSKIAPLLATRGELLDKDDLDAGVRIDEKIFLSLLDEYNDESNEAYGQAAYELNGLKDPNDFDQYPSGNWEGAKKYFQNLGAEYEKSLRLWTKSGTHCDYDDLDSISPDLSGTTNPVMLYMHKHMQVNKGLLSSCASLLPMGLSNQSGIRGRPTKQPPTGHLITKAGGRCGPGGKKKVSVSSNAASNSARLALDSIASKNEAKTRLLEQQEHSYTLNSFMQVRDDNRRQHNIWKGAFDEFVDHCGGNKTIAAERIERVRDGEDDEDDPDSQDTFIHDLIEMDDNLTKMNKHQLVISEKLDALLPKDK